LAELAPVILPLIPPDAFADGQYVLRRHAGGQATLISWGGNGADDAGKDVNDDQIIALP
jgi:hypothetical protein